MAMAFNLTSCAQYEEVAPATEAKGDFAIYAPITRTTNDGMNTAWVAKDEINVFHAVGETTNYVNDTPYIDGADNPFVCENATEGYFLGSLYGTLDPEEEYDWYAFYPYSSYIVTPANDSNGYSYVGGRSDRAQTQTGNNSMAHIAGSNYPMAGYAVAVPGGQQPTLKFKHITSLIEFEVVNKLSEAITVSQIEFTATEDIVGSYFINFADFNNLKFTPSKSDYVANTVTLAVADGAEIAANASAKFYAAVKPFTAKAGSKLSIKVSAISNTGLGAHEQDLTLSSDTAFSAGKLKTIKVNYTTAIEAPGGDEGDVTITTVGFEASEGFTATTTYNNTTAKTFGKSGKQWSTICGTVATNDAITGSQSMQMRVYKSTGPVAPYVLMSYTEPTVSKISFKAKTSDANNTLKLSYKTTGDWVDVTTYTLATSAKEYSYEFDAALENVSFKFTFVYPSNYTDKSKIVIDDVTFTSVGNGGGSTPVEPEPATPVLSITPATLSFDAAGGNKTVTCTIENEVSGVNVTATEDVDWLSTSVSGKTVTITATENTGAERTANVTIAYEGAESKTVTVSQAAAEQGGGDEGGSGEPIDATLSFADKAQRTLLNTTQQIWEQNGIKLVNDKGSSTSNVGDYANPARFYKSSKITITAPGNITKIVFDANSASYATALSSSNLTGTVTTNSDKVTVVLDGTSDTYTIASLTGGQVRMDALTITYLQ